MPSRGDSNSSDQDIKPNNKMGSVVSDKKVPTSLPTKDVDEVYSHIKTWMKEFNAAVISIFDANVDKALAQYKEAVWLRDRKKEELVYLEQEIENGVDLLHNPVALCKVSWKFASGKDLSTFVPPTDREAPEANPIEKFELVNPARAKEWDELN